VLIAGSEGARKRKGEALLGRLATLGAQPEYEVLPETMNRNMRLVSAQDHARIATNISRWMTDRAAPSERDARPATRPPGRAECNRGARREMNEEPFLFGEADSLFGVLTHPVANAGAAERPAILLVNAGPGTRIGPHRQYVRMARQWALIGFRVLRVDLSGSGDSAGVPGANESDPYPRQAIADARAAMDELTRRFGSTRFIIGGVCSGADIAFCVALEEPRVVGTLVLNPRTFALGNIPDLDQRVRAYYLSETVTSKRNWRKILRGEAGLRGTAVRVVQVLGTAAVNLQQKVLAQLGRASDEVSAVDVPTRIRGLLARGVDTLLVVGTRDVGILFVEMFYRQRMRALERLGGFRRVEFDGIDHLFTSIYAQELLLETITGHLRTKYGEPAQLSSTG
jgi:pimeloyl-ACP methyl ester carboxylesterase